MLGVVADAVAWNEGVLDLLPSGPVVNSPSSGIILMTSGGLADLDAFMTHSLIVS